MKLLVAQHGCLLLPADGRLAVRRPLGGAQRLAHLGLRQAQGEPADLERFGEFPNLLQVDPVHLAGGGLRVCDTAHGISYIFPSTGSFSRVNGANIQTYARILFFWSLKNQVGGQNCFSFMPLFCFRDMNAGLNWTASSDPMYGDLFTQKDGWAKPKSFSLWMYLKSNNRK